MNQLPNLPPKLLIIRDALIKAINQKINVTLRYGRGSKPGTTRVIKPISLIDEDFIEGIQLLPENRGYSQKYRISCIIECIINDQKYFSQAAQEKCKNYIEYYTRSEELNKKIQSIESRENFILPKNIIKIKPGNYIWNYQTEKLGVHLTAPTDQNIAAFVELANAVAIEDWGGRTWVVIDAMFKYQISWPGWYLYGSHLKKKIDGVNSRGFDLNSIDWEFKCSDIDWPGSDLFLDPLSIIAHQKIVSPLYASIHQIPNDLKIAYIHDVRPKIHQYNYSQLLKPTGSFHNESLILRLYDHGLADGSLKTIIETTTIKAMRDALEHANIPPPEKKRSREAHLDLILKNPELADQFARQLWKHRRSIFLKAPDPLTWTEFHDLRAQIILMGKLLYEHLSGQTSSIPFAEYLLSGAHDFL